MENDLSKEEKIKAREAIAKIVGERWNTSLGLVTRLLGNVGNYDSHRTNFDNNYVRGYLRKA